MYEYSTYVNDSNLRLNLALLLLLLLLLLLRAGHLLTRLIPF